MITAAQIPVPSGSAVPLPLIPPGAQATLSAPGGTIYLGGTGVTTSTGAPVTGFAPLPLNPATGSATTLWAIAASGTVATGLIVATPR